MDPFKSVTFRREYPTHDVAEHEVLMSFGGDSEAVAFREWWNLRGAEDFARHLKAVEHSRSRQTEGEG